jgi:galactitol-specific phosphotransferase system IIB component
MRRSTAIAILISLPLSGALADIFRSVDAQGHVQYSDTPTPGAELVHMNNGRVPIRSAPLASSTAKPTSLAQNSDQIHQQIEQEAAARSVQSDVAQTRADQCKKATDAYNGSVQARRIYKTGPDGEHEFLTDDEADKQRLTYKLQMDSACKGQ